MEYRNMKDAKVSLLGFGCMRFPVREDGEVDRPRSCKMLDAAYDAGVTDYETAYPYHAGESELVVGEWQKTKPRESLLIATKYPSWELKEAGDIEKTLNEQLSKLQTDYIDFYLLHALNTERWEKYKSIGIFKILDDLKAKGLVRHIGFSFHDDYPVFEEIINAYNWDFCQIQLNYMDNEYQAGVKGCALAKEKGIPIVVMEPIKGGSLANPPEEIRSHFEALHPDWSPASWALRWCAEQDSVKVILSGMSTEEQVADNLKTFSSIVPLAKADFDAIAEAAVLYRKRILVPCTGCRYCMPCPAGVHIPDVFTIYNDASIYQNKEGAKRQYDNLDEGAGAESCIACGACMEHCPQSLQIPDFMKDIAAWAKTL